MSFLDDPLSVQCVRARRLELEAREVQRLERENQRLRAEKNHAIAILRQATLVNNNV